MNLKYLIICYNSPNIIHDYIYLNVDKTDK